MLNAHRLGNGGRAFIWLSAAIAIAMTFCCVGFWSLNERERIIGERGYRAGADLAHVLEEQVVRSIQAVDLTLAGIADALRRLPPTADQDPVSAEGLRQKLVALPYVRSFLVLDRDGFIVQDSNAPARPRINLGDRDYFTAHADDPVRGLHIEEPLVSRGTGRPFIGLSRRVSRPDGSFGGIVMAALEPEYFESFYAALRLSERDSINLFLRDGTLIVRAPPLETLIGQSFADYPLFRQNLSERVIGSYRSLSAPDDRPRIVSYRGTNDYGVVVAVMISEDGLLAGWRRNTIVSFATAFLFALAIVTIAFAYLRIRRRYDHAQEQHLRAQQLEMLGQMTGGIAHDFNNLLAVISSCMRVLRRSDALSQEPRRVLEQTVAAVEQGRALTTRLLAFAKRQELQVRAANLNLQLLAIEPLLRQAAGFKVSIKLDLADDAWLCSVDTTQFDSAMLNLIVNARDAMPHGGRIRIRTRNLTAERCEGFHVHPGDYVSVAISDTGEGMTPETLRRVAEPFFTTKGNAGTGLGLSQVYGFVRQVGGDLKIESEVGSGTTVHLLFARASGAEQTQSAVAKAPQAGAQYALVRRQAEIVVAHRSRPLLKQAGHALARAAMGKYGARASGRDQRR
jgi:two-component system, NtrC family, sensor kinase